MKTARDGTWRATVTGRDVGGVPRMTESLRADTIEELIEAAIMVGLAYLAKGRAPTFDVEFVCATCGGKGAVAREIKGTTVRVNCPSCKGMGGATRPFGTVAVRCPDGVTVGRK